MSKVELKIDDVTVYASGTTIPGPGPTPPPTPTPQPPGPPPTPGVLGQRYDVAPSASAKIIFLTDEENTALQAAGRATSGQMANLMMWFYYNGIKGMSKNRVGGGWQYTYPLNVGGQMVLKIDTGTADADTPSQPVPRAP